MCETFFPRIRDPMTTNRLFTFAKHSKQFSASCSLVPWHPKSAIACKYQRVIRGGKEGIDSKRRPQRQKRDEDGPDMYLSRRVLWQMHQPCPCHPRDPAVRMGGSPHPGDRQTKRERESQVRRCQEEGESRNRRNLRKWVSSGCHVK